MTRPAQRGFTLLEMSIVLVIIAMIIGGIVVSKDLVHAAQLRAITGEVARYRQAVVNFRDKYHALPGDFAGATAIWGAVNADPTACQTAASLDATTCNGDGNGSITSAGIPNNYYESFRAWQHLANAGMIEGAYNGVTSTGSSFNAALDVNVPRSRLKEAGYTFTYMLMDAYVEALVFGAQTTTDITEGPVLTPNEALSIDAKIDDGIPDMGNVRSIGAGCVTVSPGVNTVYKASSDNTACAFNFSLGF